MHVGELKEQTNASRLLRKFGIFGFLFFLIKGLLWIIIPSVLAYMGAGGF